MNTEPGNLLVVGGNLYSVCGGCGEIIRMNKPLVGDFHFCVTDEERRLYARQIAAKAARNLRAIRAAR